MVRRKKTKLRNIAAICSAAVLMLIGSVMAYFSSKDEASNRLTAWWRFDITLTEENWDPDSGESVVPGDILPKDPKITNGAASAYVFMKVTVPCVSPEIEHENGDNAGKIRETISAENPIPLYKFGVKSGDSYLFDENLNTNQKVNTGWTLLNGMPKQQGNYYIYVYAYTDGDALKRMDRMQTTETPLFDAVKICNFNEASGLMEKDMSILVEARGIQCDNLEIVSPTPENVWALLADRG